MPLLCVYTPHSALFVKSRHALFFYRNMQGLIREKSGNGAYEIDKNPERSGKDFLSCKHSYFWQRAVVKLVMEPEGLS